MLCEERYVMILMCGQVILTGDLVCDLRIMTCGAARDGFDVRDCVQFVLAGDLVCDLRVMTCGVWGA